MFMSITEMMSILELGISGSTIKPVGVNVPTQKNVLHVIYIKLTSLASLEIVLLPFKI
uniref:Uncharacterized protein n=1 Tax=Rhizophora mucronata TaxID=61149 RepID=A0A2P2NII7_RHIMU